MTSNPLKRMLGTKPAADPETEPQPSFPDARSEVLARISAALGREGTVGEQGFVPADHEPPEIPAHQSVTGELDREGLVALLTDRLVDYDAGVTRVSEAEVPATVARLLGDAKRIVVPDDLDDALLSEVTAEVRQDSGSDPTPKEELNTVIDAVVTGSQVAIADTGTICLSGPGCGRRAITLVPDHHICLVFVSDIVQLVPEAVAVLIERELATLPQTWVSGPSATVDIELERVAGVHGPRTLDVVLVDD
ncbi:LUD domain-containing protein [Brevibacterium sp. 91QC2O2]|uniref:LutC/YkgG family protein n=1 Tax=Brevibacterium sp. 91QC2O2 TaxID=2968458 RepID=UPI00211CFEE9|nr:LUD domain-containing protein [Brevibacterium sp. 91QC2O2]MCQ9368132.1 LUD domain-containing protein [Brevibacterium sp. 91QC2O2]